MNAHEIKALVVEFDDIDHDAVPADAEETQALHLWAWRARHALEALTRAPAPTQPSEVEQLAKERDKANELLGKMSLADHQWRMEQRDKLWKAEAEIERLRAELAAPKRHALDCAQREGNRCNCGYDEAKLAPQPAPTREPQEGRAESESERTVRSLATMLGWVNVPPRHILEAEIRALKARAACPQPSPEPQEAINWKSSYEQACVDADDYRDEIRKCLHSIREMASRFGTRDIYDTVEAALKIHEPQEARKDAK
jgi:hypothetical protein